MSGLRLAAICATVGLVFGAVGGFVVGEQVGKVWLRFWHQSMAHQGYQAYTALELMDQGETERLREYLENEVDFTLALLEADEFRQQVDARVYERLQSYRSAHPR